MITASSTHTCRIVTSRAVAYDKEKSNAPNDKRPICAMPKTAYNENHEEISFGDDSTKFRSTQRNE